MKQLFTFSALFLFFLNLNANELQWVNEQIEAIKPPREGISEAKIKLLESPFIFLKTTAPSATAAPVIASVSNGETATSLATNVPVPKKFILDAIINEAALIDGVWYRVNDKVAGYTISEITAKSVTLSKKAKKKILSTRSENLNLKFKNK